MIIRTDAIPSDGDDFVELIRSDVERRTNGSIRNLAVSFHDGSIVLSGETSRYYGKQLATSAVLEDASLNDFGLCNEIVVTPSAELAGAS